MLSAMMSEERAEAERKFAAMKEGDVAMMQKTIDNAWKHLEMDTAQVRIPGTYAPEAERQTTQKRVRFWSNCKAKAGSENFCEYCGSSLKRQ